MDIKPPPKKRPRPIATKQQTLPTLVPESAASHPDVAAEVVVMTKSKWVKRVALGFVATVILLVIAAVAWYNVSIAAVNSADSSHKRVQITGGMNVAQIAHTLRIAGLIRDEAAFRLYADFTHTKDKLQAGVYLLSPSQSVGSIVDALVTGKTDTVNVTILPGKRLDQVKAILEKTGYTSAEIDRAFTAAYPDAAALFADKPADTSLEGYVYPETYQIDGTSTPQSLLARTFDLFQQKIADQGIAAKLQAEGLSLYQGITLASIVEQEAKPQDRAQVAQVFLLRIKDGMQLGSDVTAIYGAIHDGIKLPSDPAAAADMAITHDSPYNTRMHGGLPPGPISNFDIGALEAVASPASGNYLFFVVGDDGKTYFATTEAEHEQNVQNYCHKLCS